MATAAATDDDDEHGRLVFENEFPEEFRELIPTFYSLCMKFFMDRMFGGKTEYKPSVLPGLQIEFQYSIDDYNCNGAGPFKYCVYVKYSLDSPIKLFSDPHDKEYFDEIEILFEASMCLGDDDGNDSYLWIDYGIRDGVPYKLFNEDFDAFEDIVCEPLNSQWEGIQRSKGAFAEMRRAAEIDGDGDGDGEMDTTAVDL